VLERWQATFRDDKLDNKTVRDATRCDATRRDAMRCETRCDAMRRDAMRCDRLSRSMSTG
jgi:hypothetical protein